MLQVQFNPLTVVGLAWKLAYLCKSGRYLPNYIPMPEKGSIIIKKQKFKNKPPKYISKLITNLFKIICMQIILLG